MNEQGPCQNRNFDNTVYHFATKTNLTPKSEAEHFPTENCFGAQNEKLNTQTHADSLLQGPNCPNPRKAKHLVDPTLHISENKKNNCSEIIN
jgi:hypothetical protein